MDKVLKIGETTVQLGNNSDRIYVMKLKESDMPDIIVNLNNIAKKNGYSKIIAKVPNQLEDEFTRNGYIKEGYIPNFFSDNSSCCFMSKYTKESRSINKNEKKIKEIIEASKVKTIKNSTNAIPFNLRVLKIDEAQYVAKLYKKVFKSYPFPIFDFQYIEKTMKDNIIYCGAWDNEKLIGVASSEMDFENKNSEMTDFAVLDEYRGQNIALALLEKLETLTIERNIKTFYTIARAGSYGMNITFSKNNYTYAGTLVNNTNIAGGIESMNLWYKNIK